MRLFHLRPDLLCIYAHAHQRSRCKDCLQHRKQPINLVLLDQNQKTQPFSQKLRFSSLPLWRFMERMLPCCRQGKVAVHFNQACSTRPHFPFVTTLVEAVPATVVMQPPPLSQLPFSVRSQVHCVFVYVHARMPVQG